MTAELLAPAGDELTAQTALLCGADAVYLGLSQFSARNSAENFDFTALKRTIQFAHLLKCKIYVCLNTLIKDSETEAFFDSVRNVWDLGADAILMQDLFLGKYLKEQYPQIVLHLSTQAGCCNEYGAAMARDYGFSRVVLARETPIKEIRKISKRIETEAFVQGAICTCFSGQCYMSSFAGNNSGNRGRCKQPCRKRYSINRQGFEDFAFALSPRDLCVKDRVKELLDAGVVSLKIEGRMRRSEYVAAAIRYYLSLLSGKDGKIEFQNLKRSFNRGDYTFGLAFGQENFLSRKVQGHIGEMVGILGKNHFCKSQYLARKGDGFKILRRGLEVGGAVFNKSGKGGFYLSSNQALKIGDEVRLTTDSTLRDRIFSEFSKRKRKIRLSVLVKAGEALRVSCGDFFFSGQVVDLAQNAPLTAEEVKECFCKTGSFPFEVEFDTVVVENAFLLKSTLNAIRREFYLQLIEYLCPSRVPLPRKHTQKTLERSRNVMTAFISSDLKGLKADILIYKCFDLRKIEPSQLKEGEGEKYLFLPPFFSGEDLSAVENVLPFFKGIYCDGYYGLDFAKKHHLKFIAGTGFNLTNRYAVSEVKRAGADFLVLSKELCAFEQDELSIDGAFVLNGAVKVMDLCYCPFEKSCALCDRKNFYTLKDEEGRKFPLRRYQCGDCRFELYNCAPLAPAGNYAGKVTDLSVSFENSPFTRGHAEKSML